jgi:hypothetical protein
MEDRPDCKGPFERLEGLLDLDQLQVVLPELAWVGLGEVGTQQITAFATARLAQLLATEPEAE